MQQKLRTLSPDDFQKLLTGILYYNRNKFLASPGSVVAKSTTSPGHPDALFKDETGYVMCEFTTKQGNICEKLKNDIDSCLNYKNISNKDISKIILGFANEISNTEMEQLQNYVNFNYDNKIKLEFFDIQNISMLALQFPGIEFYMEDIGIETNLLTLNDFKIRKKGTQPSLNNSFFGRKKELEYSINFLNEGDFLIISGESGLGKSKLATKIANELEETENFNTIVIQHLFPNLKKSLRNCILPDSNLLLIFDDLNGDYENLEDIIQFIENLNIINKFKFIFTVRSMFKSNLDSHLLNYLIKSKTIVLDNLNEVVISKIVEDYSKNNNLFVSSSGLEWVNQISKGNPRLAIMALYSRIDERNNLSNNVNIYKNYFNDVQRERDFLEDKKSLQALGILSFFGELNKNEEYLNKILELEFNINWEILWECYENLSRLELVDQFENKVSISNQPLSDYILYELFFEKEIIDLKKWFLIFFNNYSEKIKIMIVNLTNIFSKDVLENKIFDCFLDEAKKRLNYSYENLKFFKIFYYYFEIYALKMLDDWINSIPKDLISLNDIKILEIDNEHISNSEIDLLINFIRTPNCLNQSLKLCKKLILKNPSVLPELSLKLYKESIFSRFDLNSDYEIQKQFINFWEDLKNSKLKYLSEEIFIKYAPNFLNCYFDEESGVKNLTLHIYSFKLQVNYSLLSLRSQIIKKLFDLYYEYPNEILKIINEYIINAKYFDEDLNKVYSKEKYLFFNFFNKNFSCNEFLHCILIRNYLDILQEKTIEIRDMDTFINSPIMNFLNIYFPINPKLSIKEDIILNKKLIKKDLEIISLNIIKKILKNIDIVYSFKKFLNKNFDNIPSYLFEAIVENNDNLLFLSFEYYYSEKLDFNLNQICVRKIFHYIISNDLIVAKKLYQILNDVENKNKELYLQIFFGELQEKSINLDLLYLFIHFVKNANTFDFINIDQYYVFNKIFSENSNKFKDSFSHTNIITYIVDIRINCFECGYVTSWFCKDNKKYFLSNQKDFNILKEVLFLELKDPFIDINEIQILFYHDKKFLVDFIERIISKKESEFPKNLDLSFVWSENNIEPIILNSINLLIKKDYNYLDKHPINVFFNNDIKFQNRQKKFIHEFIKKYYFSERHIVPIMNVVLNLFKDFFWEFLKEYLLTKPQINSLKKIDLYPKFRIVGNELLYYQSQLKFIKNIRNNVNYLDSLDYWSYIDYLNGLILDLINKIK